MLLPQILSMFLLLSCFLFKNIIKYYLHAKSLQSCRAFCSAVDCGPLASSIHVFLQARILEWVGCPPPGDLPDPGIELVSQVSCTDRRVLYHQFHLGSPNNIQYITFYCSASVKYVFSILSFHPEENLYLKTKIYFLMIPKTSVKLGPATDLCSQEFLVHVYVQQWFQ